MYILDSQSKRLIKAEKCTFKSLNLKERQDLQEWIVKEPSSLGEDLLIIQKEYNGFADTNERLDLLALDKEGNLVVIENKLDDSGKDVTWQAIKYASYCSTLSKKQVIEIYQEYLDKIGCETPANEALLEFFNKKDLDDVKINTGSNQRIILVAANFQKEVTSAVLWLQNFALMIKCVKVTPYRYNNQIMLEFDTLIPIENTEDYQIKKSNKAQEESVESEATIIRYDKRQKFWGEFIEYNKMHNGLYSASAAVTDNWLSKSVTSIKGGTIEVIINKDNCRVELYINSGDKGKNKEIFDKLYTLHENVDKQIEDLEWQRMDDKVTCRVRLDKSFSYLNPSDKQNICEFFVTTSQKMMDLFSELGKKLNLKQ